MTQPKPHLSECLLIFWMRACCCIFAEAAAYADCDMICY